MDKKATKQAIVLMLGTDPDKMESVEDEAQLSTGKDCKCPKCGHEGGHDEFELGDEESELGE